MKADTLTLAQVFNKPVSFLVPLFQRPYVWNEEKHWLPLWEDIRSVAERLIAERAVLADDEADKGLAELQTPPHFLGALVVEQLLGGAGMVDRRRVIDGQQRLTTLQLFLSAAHDVAAEFGDESARLFGKLTENDPDLVKDLSDTYKIWPTNADRLAFRMTMKKDEEAVIEARDVSSSSVWRAHQFFCESLREWLSEPDSTSVPDRLDVLRTVLWSLIRMVVIDLDPNDNAQVIFETLNARGTPLLASDLVKNAVFQAAIDDRLDAELLYRRYWSKLDEEWWRQEVRQGRLFRPRLDVFFTHWLTMRKGSEFGVHELFSEFKRFAFTHKGSTEELLADAVRYAQVYESFSSQDPGTLEATFFHRLDVMQTTTATPLLLYVMGLPEEELTLEQRHRILLAIESWLVRRMVCRLTTKNYNIYFLQLLSLVLKGPSTADRTTVEFFAGLEGESGVWPSEEELQRSLLTLPLYKVLGRGRVRMVLEALEEALRAEHPGYAEAPAPMGLSIEHILPQQWNTSTWPLPPDQPPEVASQRRDVLKHTLGNLTLITGKLNSAQSNLPWEQKRRQLQKYAVLYLNKSLADESLEWDEQAIEEWGRRLAELAIGLWPGPEALLSSPLPQRPEPLLVAQPQSRTRSSRKQGSVRVAPELYEDFWREFLSEGRKRFPEWGLKKRAPRGPGMRFSSGRSGVWYVTRFDSAGLAVHCYVRAPGLFEHLLSRRAEIEKKFGSPLTWDPYEGYESSRITIASQGSIEDRSRWEEYREWFFDMLVRLRDAVRPEILGTSIGDGAAQAPRPFTHEEIRSQAENDFVRRAVDQIEEWLASLEVPGLEVRHNKGTHHSVYVMGRMLGGWYITPKHIRFWLQDRRPNDDQLRGLSHPDSLTFKEKSVSGNMMNDSDLGLYQRAVRARLQV